MMHHHKRVTFHFNNRASGLLMHPTSLPGRFGNGDIGPSAHAFVDFLARAGQRWWQMLPVGPPGEGNSPYSATSAFAGNPALVNLNELVRHGLLRPNEIRPPRFSRSRVEHKRVLSFRDARLRLAFERFQDLRGGPFEAFQAFERASAFWLEDFCVFAALKKLTGGKPWTQWDPDVRTRKPAAIAKVKRDLVDEISFQRFVQFEFDRQWRVLRDKCAKRNIGLIGDIPIFVAYDSAEVWANPNLFLLDKNRRPTVVSGCPPDFFNKNGQMWNHPHYNWPAHAREGFRWWVERFRQTLRLFDAVRIDHFIGFHRAWAIPAGHPNARRGRYTPGAGHKLFDVLCKRLGDVPILAEDLGSVTPEVFALRDRFNFPGMRVLQFGFGDGGAYHLPHRYVRRAVVYTGTHDNDTTVGWLATISAAERRRVVAYTGSPRGASNGAITWGLMRTALSSVADTAIFPVQDLLGLGSESRMNVPGRADGNWGWRLREGQLTGALARRLRELCELCGRA
jgi:4-alpha-glucanotransferase